MATDIAFALGVLALLGDRVPPALRVFLAALAIVDDLGAVLVIAIFYSDGIRMAYLGAGLGVLLGLVLLARLGMRSLGLYALAGAAVWVFFLKSGVHPTVAGVLLAMTIPARVAVEGPRFLEKARKHLGEFASETSRGRILTPSQHEALLGLTGAAQGASAPLQRLEHALHPWVTFGIMPLFALANAGVALDVGGTGGLWGPVTAGTAAGLLLGKPLGILAGAYLVVRTGLCPMPDGAGWRTLAGVGCLAGIGFRRLRLLDFFWALAFLLASNLLLSLLALLLAQFGLEIPGELELILPKNNTERIFWVLLSFTAGFCEEAAFRGYLLTRIKLFGKTRGWLLPVIISSLAFGSGHAYQGLGGFILLSIYGAMFALLFLRTGSLWPPIIAHFFQDFSALFFPFQK